MTRVRVATYNVHKCVGLDWRLAPHRIAAVIREIEPDILALQEVFSEQAAFLAEAAGMRLVFGPNRTFRGSEYGNATLSRAPLHAVRNYDLSVGAWEPRGCLHSAAEVDGCALQVFNVHLGTSFFERRKQAPKLASVLSADRPRIVLGDFNEWTRGTATRTLAGLFLTADLFLHLRRTRTYPGLLPVLNLDHIYFDPELELERLALHGTRRALIASDHLPLVADFALRCPAPPAP